jgi:hypothetical protein
MKKKSIVLHLRKSKIANLHTIYGGGTATCVPTEDPIPPDSDRCTDDCTSSDGGVLDSLNPGDTKP